MAVQALNRLAKWRVLLTGWQLGTRAKGDPEGDAVRDHREATLLLRVEVSALVQLLTDKGIFTNEDWSEALIVEAHALEHMLERKFPGVTANDDGLNIDLERAMPWMKGWKP